MDIRQAQSPKGWMYILECSDGSYYVGSANNIELRIEQHNNGEGANHTKKRLPVTLVYLEEFDRIDEAFYREKQVQGWNRKKKEALINGTLDLLNELAECKNETHYSNAAFDGFDSTQPPETAALIALANNKNSSTEKNQSLSDSEISHSNERCLSGVEGNSIVEDVNSQW